MLIDRVLRRSDIPITLAASILLSSALAQSLPIERPAALHVDATWPTATQWAAQAGSSFESVQLVRVEATTADGRVASLVARARAYPDRDRLQLFTTKPGQRALQRRCRGYGCTVPHDDEVLRVVERLRHPADTRTRDARHYAHVLTTFEGNLYQTTTSTEHSVAYRELTLPARNDVDEHAWIDQVLLEPTSVVGSQLFVASTMAKRLGRNEDALLLGRLFVPELGCSLDGWQDPVSLADLARSTDHTGLAIDATLQSMDYGSEQALARRSQGYTPSNTTDWTEGLAGVDIALLIEGVVADSIANPPILQWAKARHLFIDAPRDTQREVIQRLQRPSIDPWNQLLLLLVTRAAIQQDGLGFAAEWEGESFELRIDPLLAHAVLNLSGDSAQ